MSCDLQANPWDPRPAAVPRLAKGAPNAWSMAKLSELCQQQGVVSTLRSKGVAILPQAFEAGDHLGDQFFDGKMKVKITE